MEGNLTPFVLLLALLTLQLCSADAFPSRSNTQYIRTSCSVTNYPRLCYNSLSIYAGKIKTNPKALAHTALNVTIAATQETSVIMRRLSKIHGLKPIESAAALDCMEEIGDAVDELQNSIDELSHVIRGSNFWLQMSDIQTWVSVALTDEDTCMDGFDEHNMSGRVENLVRRYIVNVAHLTCNALALINSYASASTEAFLP
ncbi:21 kDa protein-like [Malus sylvestris]|uniref:21 kDa protein-like n=1 Tax=Malus sylvestris TaxID=3752 RepID=UPI0021AC18AB|nr:21 kDa protein-like [Malus sylvestris]